MAYICLVLSLIACSSSTSSSKSGITVKGSDGTEYESYQECCAALDFQAAHQYLAKLQNSEEQKEDLYVAKDFVFKQEALYLMGQGDETSKKRILYLLKEEGANSNRLDMLIDLAILNDDDNFVMTLANQYNNERIDNPNLISYLISKNSKQYSDFVLKNLPVINLPRPSIGYKTYWGCVAIDEKIIDYRDAISKYNEKVLNILNQAILNKNLYLAKNVVSKAIPNIEIEEIGFIDDNHYRYNVKKNNLEVNEVNSIYKDALSKGKFN